jgi:beta-lactam-binding protein with PASTA domain
MKVQARSRQRGLSFFGLVIVGALILFGAVIGAKVAPTVIEYQAILKAAHKAKTGSTVAEVRSIFDKAAAIDDITSIRPEDLQITKKGDKVVVSFAYNKEFELGGPAYLVIKYSGTTE